MAEALISVVLEQLISYGVNEVTLVADTRDEVEKLTANLEMVQAVLVDADEKQVKSNSVRLWLDNLKQVVYDADDVLDEWLTRAAISQIQTDVHVITGTRNKVFSYLLSPCLCFKRVIFHYDISRQIKVINKRLDLIAKQRRDFGLKVVKVHQNHGEDRQLNSSVTDVSEIHGRDQAKEEMISRLLSETSFQGKVVRVIAIVGIGGLGKTTLAKFIFNERRVVEIFKTKMWVCVSEPFNLVEVAKAIIKEAGGRVPDTSVWQEVHKSLCESVEGKRFLIVLDDVWTEDPSHWQQLKLAFNSGAPGSRIVVTTRNKTVAKKMGCTDPDIHDLEILSEDDSWSVIVDVALVGREEEELKGFEEVGRKIANKCKGIPLAIRTVASLLCDKQTKQEWEKVLSSDLWEMREIKDFFLPSLFLSYCSLDPISKQCFQYSVLFPKDFQMQKDRLIKLWMAQGFFEFGERRDLESIGDEQFHILAMRSFFQDFEKDSDGNITSCKMHDLVHDFAMYISQNEYSHIQAGGKKSASGKTHHLYANDLEIPCILKGRKLRTFVWRLGTAVPVKLFNKLACLRTLVLHDSEMKVLPKKVGKLIHMRYLDLSGSNELDKLPETICNLYNLQVLALNGCEKLRKLPEKIGKLSNLRHLEIEGTNYLSCFPKSIATLSSLRTLSKFIVSDRDRGCNIGDLQLLNNLRGALKLEWLGRVTNCNEADRAKLNEKKNLRKLTLDFGSGISDVRIRMKSILEKLEPHEDVEVIQISNYTDTVFPGWFQSCSLLTHIVQMSLYGCNGCKELPAFGKLPTLKTLMIERMNSVTRIGSEFYGEMTAFPKLESFVIQYMEKLEEWEVPISKDRKIMPLLVKMSLSYLYVLRALPCLGSLESLKRLELSSLRTVKRIGDEFYGFGADSSSLDLVDMIAFPKLKTFEIKEFSKLEEWEVPISKDRKIMPLLVKMSLSYLHVLRALPCLGSLESLERLEMSSLRSVKRIGDEFYGFGANSSSLGPVDMIAFPKLKTFEIKEFSELEEWDIPISKDRKIMPLLVKIRLSYLSVLRALPCLGSLESLETLNMSSLESMKYIGDEFYGFGADNSSLGPVEMIAFPKLKTFDIYELRKLEEWDIPISQNRKIMPLISELKLSKFPKLRALPRVWRMESLEELRLVELESLERVGGEFGNEGSLQQDGVTFPKLKKLEIEYMLNLEEWSVPLIVPCLEKLHLENFWKLKTLPTFKECMKTLESLDIQRMYEWEGQEKLLIISDKEGSSSSSNNNSQGGDYSCGLRRLYINKCPKLCVVPDYMFSWSLQHLDLEGDLGDLYNSFPTDDRLCFITKIFLMELPHPSLPKGFHQLKALQSVKFILCSTLDFDLKEELGHLTMLQYLEIIACPLLEKRFKGDEWRTILAHLPTINIDGREITKY